MNHDNCLDIICGYYHWIYIYIYIYGPLHIQAKRCSRLKSSMPFKHDLALQSRGCHTSFFPFSENEEWGRGTLSLNGGGPILGGWRMENGEWRKFLLLPGEECKMEKTSCAKFSPQSTTLTSHKCFSKKIHTIESAWWMRKRTSNPSVWIEHKFLPHAGGNGKPILHSPFSTGHKGVSHFLHGEAILLAPLFPHSSFSILRGGVTTPNISLSNQPFKIQP
jgi:hypothetical protein